jgi:hypothetical protein
MPESQFHSNSPSLLPIERPECNKRMHLARAMPGLKGFDLRNFECEKCDKVVTLTVAADPMTSDAIRWLAADLRPRK